MDQNPVKVLLVSLPPEESRLEFAGPMGTPAHLAPRIAELLPGTTFDEERHGIFRRGGYEITFDFVAEHTAIAQATAVEVTVGSGEGFTALKRIVEKMDWRAIDPVSTTAIDLDRSRAAGRVVLASAESVSAAPAPPRAPIVPLRLVLQAGAAIGLVIVAVSAIGMWNRHSALMAARAAEAAAAEIAAPPAYLHMPSMPGGVSPAEARAAFAPQVALAAEEMRRRFVRVKDLAPEFRSDEIVHQLLQYREATTVFPASAGENGFMSPDRLSDAALFAQFHAVPRLPAWFAEATRDGYVFTFTGDDCSWRPKMVELGTLCYGFVYSARPIESGRGGRSYALFSSDERVHYRADGAMPGPSDAGVDTGASTGPDGDAAAALTPSAQEANALRDLWQVSAVEPVASALTGGGYFAPESLASGPPRTAILPARFAQPLRQGYKFEFVGNEPLSGSTAGAVGTAYQSYVYVATPQAPGSARRRTFALYPEGIFATTERRVPTPQDERITAAR